MQTKEHMLSWDTKDGAIADYWSLFLEVDT